MMKAWLDAFALMYSGVSCCLCPMTCTGRVRGEERGTEMVRIYLVASTSLDTVSWINHKIPLDAR